SKVSHSEDHDFKELKILTVLVRTGVRALAFLTVTPRFGSGDRADGRCAANDNVVSPVSSSP
ncbi:MAG TPA: hypothetical protein VIR28_20810, partial [Achromobacter sp.]|uniref:hypothetical protein n=1 Tax=Achromobacter sp. TaxID=134375 RepID=UPI002F94E158